MGVVKRYNTLQNLEDIDVLIDEFETSRYINLSGLGNNSFPDSFPQGKTAFLIDSTPFLKSDVEFQIDIFDALGNSIYHEPIVIGTEGYLEGRSRAISVEIHEDTEPGIATMIIAAEIEAIPTGPSIFSLIFEKPFYTVTPASKNNNSRQQSLMHMVGLEDRLIKEGNPVDLEKMNTIMFLCRRLQILQVVFY